MNLLRARARTPRRGLVRWAPLALAAGLGSGCLPPSGSTEDAVEPWVLEGVGACAHPIERSTHPEVVRPPEANSGFAPPIGPGGQQALMQMLLAAGRRDGRMVVERAGALGYAVCRVLDGEGLLFSPPSGSGGPMVLLRPGPARPVIVEVPHPLYEPGTRQQGLHAFTALGARAVLISGAHRCASAAPAGCAARVSACGGDARASDPAYEPGSWFHAAHMALADGWPDATVVGLHGTGRAAVVISDGTNAPAEGRPVERVVRSVAEVGVAREVQTCNAFEGGSTARELCGLGDVQGRHLNRAARLCADDPVAPTGRFIHVQSPGEVRGDDERARALVEAVVAGLQG